MRFLKALAFYPLLYLRGLFHLAGAFIGGMALIVCVVSLFIESAPWHLTVEAGVIGFAIFLLRQFYDQLLLKLNPTGNNLTLYQ